MPKAKRFTARKPRSQSYSTNPETVRIRELEQSRVGLAAEIAKIKTKYRTHLSRKKVSMQKTIEWKQLSENERLQRERRLKEELDAQEEEELRVAGEELMKLTNMAEQIEENQTESDSEESWKGIDDDKTSKEQSDDEAISDSDFEGGDLDVSENEDLFDENGNKISMQILSHGMKEIYDRHMERFAYIMRKYIAIDGENEE
jgi:hypothetical protein